MRSKVAILIILTVVVAFLSMARTRTTQSQLKNNSLLVEQIPDVAVPDSLLHDLEPNAVTLKGYSKKASDSRESFFVTNNTKHRISHIRLLMRYSLMNGEMLHERTATVEVDLRPGETRLVAIKTFDVQRFSITTPAPSLARVPLLLKWLSAL